MPPLPDHIFDKIAQPREMEARVNVMFDDIEREIISPAKAPDQNSQQNSVRDRRMIQQEQSRRG